MRGEENMRTVLYGAVPRCQIFICYALFSKDSVLRHAEPGNADKRAYRSRERAGGSDYFCLAKNSVNIGCTMVKHTHTHTEKEERRETGGGKERERERRGIRHSGSQWHHLQCEIHRFLCIISPLNTVYRGSIKATAALKGKIEMPQLRARDRIYISRVSSV